MHENFLVIWTRIYLASEPQQHKRPPPALQHPPPPLPFASSDIITYYSKCSSQRE